MLMILFAIVVAAAVSVFLFRKADDIGSYGGLGFVCLLAGVILAIGAGFSAIAYVFAGWNWIAADTKAQIINREYGTNYTREEIFYASDVINTIREIDRKRIEVNGNVMQQGEK